VTRQAYTLLSGANTNGENEMNVGDTVIWQSKIGPVEAEYRGKSYGMDGYEACIIVRDENAPPYQTMVPMKEVSKKVGE
jgi:hypothetical protein